jgi:hypothetical protein
MRREKFNFTSIEKINNLTTSRESCNSSHTVLQDEYVYETGGGTGEMRRNGARIVGAAKADHGSIPFIVAWTSEVDEKRVDSECTG